MTKSSRTGPLSLSLAVWVALAAPPALRGQELDELPVDRRRLEALRERSVGRSGLTNYFSEPQIAAAVRSGTAGHLSVSFDHALKLLDGSDFELKDLYGTVWAGPYPFESGETRHPYPRFRLQSSIHDGVAEIDAARLLEPPLNSEGWTDGGRLAVRFELFLAREGADRRLGTYDTAADFRREGEQMVKLPSLLQGPFVHLVESEDASRAVISFATGEAVRAKVAVTYPDGRSGEFWSESASERHEVEVSGLRHDAPSSYRIEAGGVSTRWTPLRGAPPRGATPVVFAYFGDSRAGYGGGLESHMGVNRSTLAKLSQLARSRGAEFLLVGGDLVSGYTASREDFETQLGAWKRAVSGFWCERPIYAAIGNHEALLRVFDDAGRSVRVDRWPYATESAEAVFAGMFVHPANGPVPSDGRRPTYRENVYSFQYGCVQAIAFNNNYWVSYAPERFGGSPEGYIMEDQLGWIEAELARAEEDPSVRYVVLFAQEPVFPNGGHLGDAMWHGGDNRVRAHVFRDGRVLPEEHGMLVARNRLVRSIARCSKVAAVFGSDEHAYHRILIGPEVPVGDIEKDDRNLNGKIDLAAGETCSPLSDLRFNTWYVIGGGGGAPYYAEEDAPWNTYWRERAKDGEAFRGFYYSSQENLIVLEASDAGLSLVAYNPFGEVIDRIPDLMALKDPAAPR